MATTPFDIDPHPGQPKILFIGDSSSSHVQSWIDLLRKTSFNIRLFGLPTGYPPAKWPVKTYLTFQYLSDDLDPKTRKWLFPTPNEILIQEKLNSDTQLQQAYLLWQDSLKQDALWLNALAQEIVGLRVFLSNLERKQDAEIDARVKLAQEMGMVKGGVEALAKELPQMRAEIGLLKAEMIEKLTMERQVDLSDLSAQFSQIVKKLITSKNNLEMRPEDRTEPQTSSGDIAQALPDNQETEPSNHPVDEFGQTVALVEEIGTVSLNEQVIADPINSDTDELVGIEQSQEIITDLNQPGSSPSHQDPGQWLVEICNQWQPDIVHTFGVTTASYFYNRIREHLTSSKKPIWVVQARGGPDLAQNRYLPEHQSQIRDVLTHCDQFIADNSENYKIACEMGLLPAKACSLGVLPGTGGIDVKSMQQNWKGLPSQRERIILWPKAYESPQSKALPVIEAIKLAWHKIYPCQIYFLAVVQEEIELYYQQLPEEIKSNCHLMPRVPRLEMLDMMTKARVLLAPSLSDGIPNALYEAMAAGIFPIFSPLETIIQVVKQPENVLFARNLYPEEISQALIQAMQDDELVDQAAKRNLDLVKQLADREKIGPELVQYYSQLTNLV